MSVVVSACLLGACCRFDGGDRTSARVLAAVAGETVVPVCPEVVAGLGVPRPACELRGGDGSDVALGRARVCAASGEDVTDAFLRGALAALEAAKAAGVRRAILKERSPSCGVRAVHRDGAVRAGRGVFAALLAAEGIEIASDEGV